MRCEDLRAREAEVSTLTRETDDLRSRLAQADEQVGMLRAELSGARESADQQLESIAIIGRQLEELRVGARGHATRIRLGALREAAELTARLSDAAEAQPGGRRDRLLDALEEAIDRVAGEWDAPAPRPPLGLAAGGSPRGAGGQAADAGRRVSVDIGPFEDFSQLVRFEDAANAIGATGDISIKRFSEGRARIDVALSGPVDLLRELEERCDLEFQVRSTSDDEIVLDVDSD